MATITVLFNFSDGSSGECEFEAESSLLADIRGYAEDKADDLSDDSGNDISCDEWEVVETDLDYASQQDWDVFGNYDDLDDWGEYCENVEKHGEAYCLRYEDIGDNSFEDEYEGCWASEAEFAQNLIEGCYEIPDHLKFYIDWDRYARDLMMDYSAYYGSDGYHIFRC